MQATYGGKTVKQIEEWAQTLMGEPEPDLDELERLCTSGARCFGYLDKPVFLLGVQKYIRHRREESSGDLRLS